jgi:hypothetical protein
MDKEYIELIDCLISDLDDKIRKIKNTQEILFDLKSDELKKEE